MQGARHRHAPFLMPDGRSLASVLASEARDGGADAIVRRGRAVRAGHGARAHERRWRAAAAASAEAVTAAAATATTSEPSPSSLAADLDLARLGRAKARRALNERILRVLAGPLTWSAIKGLYLPAPFGGGGPAPALSRVLPGEDGADVWEPFRSVCPDRQDRALAAWEAHVRAGRRAAGVGPAHPPADAEAAAAAAAAAGLRAWAGVCPRSRDSLKRAGPARVDDVEAPLLLWLAQHQAAAAAGVAAGGGDAAASPAPPAPALRLPAPDAWGRALIHGLAQFHGGLRVRREEGDFLFVRLPAGGGGSSSGSGEAAAGPADDAPAAAASHDDGECPEPPDTPRSSVLAPSAVPPASCGDVLAAFAAARAGGPGATPGACLRDLLLEHAAAGGAA